MDVAASNGNKSVSDISPDQDSWNGPLLHSMIDREITHAIYDTKCRNAFYTHLDPCILYYSTNIGVGVCVYH